MKGYPRKVRAGNVAVTIYANRFAGKVRFRLRYYEKGQERQEYFPDPDEAFQRSQKIAEKLDEGESNVLTFHREDQDTYLRSLAVVKPFAVSLEAAVVEWASAKEAINRRPLLEAAKYFAEKHPTNFPVKSVAELKKEFLDQRRSKGVCKRYISVMGYHLDAFAEAFECPIQSITYDQMDTFVHNLELKPKTKNHYITTIKTFFNFAKKKGYIPRDHTEATRIEKVRQGKEIIEVWSAEEMMKIIKSSFIEIEPPLIKSRESVPSNKSRRAFIPCMVIGAFAGLRSQEIQRLDWADIKLDHGVILVRDIVAGERNKTGKRTAPLTPNLRAWLLPFAQKSGKLWPYCHIHYYDTQRAIAAATALKNESGLTWKHNALRHSFISYRVQLIRNRYTVAEEAGNTPDVIRKHYLEIELPDGGIITQKEAIRWFSIYPDENMQPILNSNPEALPNLLPKVAA